MSGAVDFARLEAALGASREPTAKHICIGDSVQKARAACCARGRALLLIFAAAPRHPLATCRRHAGLLRRRRTRSKRRRPSFAATGCLILTFRRISRCAAPAWYCVPLRGVRVAGFSAILGVWRFTGCGSRAFGYKGQERIVTFQQMARGLRRVCRCVRYPGRPAVLHVAVVPQAARSAGAFARHARGMPLRAALRRLQRAPVPSASGRIWRCISTWWRAVNGQSGPGLAILTLRWTRRGGAGECLCSIRWG